MAHYKATGPVPVPGVNKGDVFEHEFTPDEESDLLRRGHVELAEREYKVVGPKRVHGTDPGGKFKAALRGGELAALTEAGHIKPVTERATTKEKE